MRALRPLALTGLLVLLGAWAVRDFGSVSPSVGAERPEASKPTSTPATPPASEPAPAPTPVAPTPAAPAAPKPAAPPIAASEAPKPAPVVEPEATSENLIVGDKLMPARAMQLLDTGFDDLLADLRQQASADASALEMRRLYIDQINDLLAGSDVSLRRMECGARVCAAELYTPDGAELVDPFSDARGLETQLPREARVELAFLDDHRNALRRFLFSIDPDVTSLHVARRED